MESTDVESQEPLFHDPTETSSKLEQEVATESSFHTGSERPYSDSTFTFLFLTVILTTFTFGIIAATRTDTLNMDTKLRLSNYNPTTNKCEITQQEAPKASDSNYPNSDSAFVKLLALTCLFALALTILFSLLLVSLLRRYTRTLVLLSAPFMFLFLGGCIIWVSSLWLELLGVRSYHIFLWVSLPLVSALLGYEHWKTWTGIVVESGVEMLRMATGFWKEHFVLLVVNPILLMGWMVMVNGPIFTFIWYAFNVGEIVPDFDVVNDPIKGCGLATGIPCCRVDRPGWVYAYITFASFTAFWVFTVSVLLQYAVVSGTAVSWYLNPTGSSAIGNFKCSLGNAYGSSFGTSCNLGTIVTTLGVALVKLLKEKLSDRVLESKDRGIMLNILRGCFSWMSQFLKHYPQLASIFLGILESSKKSNRNLLQMTSPILTTRVDTADVNLTIYALMGMTLICTLLQTLIVYGVLEYFSNALAWMKLRIAVVYCLPITLVGLTTVFTLATTTVIATVYYLYTLEKQLGKFSKPEVCQAFMTTTAPPSPENEAQVAERESVASDETQT